MIYRIQVLMSRNWQLEIHDLWACFNQYFCCRTDYYVSKASNWMQDKYIDDVKEQIQSAIGVDITSATEREEFACTVYSRFPSTSIITTRQGNWGKVMFSQASFSHSFHRRRAGCLWSHVPSELWYLLYQFLCEGWVWSGEWICPGGRYPPTWHGIQSDMVGKRATRILFEWFLVIKFKSTKFDRFSAIEWYSEIDVFSIDLVTRLIFIVHIIISFTK